MPNPPAANAFEAMLAHLPDVVSRFDRLHRHVYVNPAGERAVGLPANEIVGKRHRELGLPDAFCEQVERELDDALSGRFVTSTFTFTGPDGRDRHYHALIAPERGPDGRVQTALAVTRDVSELSTALAALAESEQRFLTMFRSSPVLTALISLDDRCMQDVNDAFLTWSGLARDEVVGRASTELACWPPLNLSDVRDRLARESVVSGLEVPFIRESGESGTMLMSVVIVTLGGRQHLLVSGVDLTERKAAERALSEAQSALAVHAAGLEELVRERTHAMRAAHERLVAEMDARSRLEREMLSSVALERERLGRELHDGLSQLLTAAKFKVALLARQAEDGDERTHLATGLHDLASDLHVALTQARDMARALTPPALVNRGLVATLEDLASHASVSYGIRCTCDVAMRVDVPDPDVALHLLRIAQEAMQNAVQHGHAARVIIRLSESGGQYRLDIDDDGSGLPTQPPGAGMGLANMHRRVEAIDGRLVIRTDPGVGSVVSCFWPAERGSASFNESLQR